MKTLKEKFGKFEMTKEQMGKVKGGNCFNDIHGRCMMSAYASFNTNSGSTPQFLECMEEGNTFCENLAEGVCS